MLLYLFSSAFCSSSLRLPPKPRLPSMDPNAEVAVLAMLLSPVDAEVETGAGAGVGAGVRRAVGRRAVVVPAPAVRVVALRAVVFEAVVLRAVPLAALDLRAVLLRAVVLRAVALRAVVLRAAVLRLAPPRAVVFLALLRAVVFLAPARLAAPARLVAVLRPPALPADDLFAVVAVFRAVLFFLVAFAIAVLRFRQFPVHRAADADPCQPRPHRNSMRLPPRASPRQQGSRLASEPAVEALP